MSAHYFASAAQFRNWLEKHHETETALLVGFYKKATRKPSMTWPESVDQALCFGWIDGVRKGVDHERYTIRFTPRKPGSIWSNVNIAKVEALRESGLMTPAGEAAFAKRSAEKSGIYSFEREAVGLAPGYEKIFRKNKKAWTYFESQPPGYKKQHIHRVMAAKQEKTRISRLEKLIAASEAGTRLA